MRPLQKCCVIVHTFVLVAYPAGYAFFVMTRNHHDKNSSLFPLIEERALRVQEP